MEVTITCKDYSNSRVRFFDCVYEEDLSSVAATIELRSSRVVVLIECTDVQPELPDFLESLTAAGGSHSVSALPELVVSAEVSDDGAIRLEWVFRETDGHCGPSSASVDIWLDSLDDVRIAAAQIRALLPA
ncbi:DUF6228 family protein [Lentzea sp. NPDC034063]|uniref:DUF6228 family protein n=1 Tax=unclassified Lentzea TaxID=2643253 RepID=UPI0033F4ABFA